MSRHPGDALRVGLGALVLLVSLLAVQRDSLSAFETNVFRLVNELPPEISFLFVGVMQAGNLLAAPVLGVAALVLLRRHRRAGLDIAGAGGLAWVAARVVKDLVERPRPRGLLEGVAGPDAIEGLGFVSGHTAVAAAMAAAAAPYLPRRWRRTVWALAWAVGAGRIYVGAHLPLDIVGGAGLGLMIGAGIHLCFGAPQRAPTLEEAAAILRRSGLAPTGLRRVAGEAKGSFPFVATIGDATVFVKLLDPEPRDRDLLYRMARFIAFRDVRDEAGVLDASAQAHREGAMALVARSRGARVPEVRGIQTRRDRVWVLQEHVEGRDLTGLAAEEITDDVLRDLWRQVEALRTARVAHRDLVASNVVVDVAGRVWIVDFAHAQTSVRARAFDNDVAELLTTTAFEVGPERAVDAALEVLGADALACALPELQELTLTSDTRARLRRADDLLERVRTTVASRVGLDPGPLVPLRRLLLRRANGRRVAGVLLSLGGAVAGLMAVAGTGTVVDSLSEPGWRWLGLAVLATVASSVLRSTALVAAVDHRLAIGRTALVGLGAARAAVLHGRPVAADLTTTYLHYAGVDRPGALRAIARADLAARAVWVLAVVGAVAGAWYQGVTLEAGDRIGWLLLVAAGALVVQLAATRGSTPAVTGASDPARADDGLESWNRTMLVVATVAGLLTGIVATYAATRVFGPAPNLAAVAAVHLAAVGAARLGPVAGAPGTGAAVVAIGLTLAGQPLAASVAAALLTQVFLLMTGSGSGITLGEGRPWSFGRTRGAPEPADRG